MGGAADETCAGKTAVSQGGSSTLGPFTDNRMAFGIAHCLHPPFADSVLATWTSLLLACLCPWDQKVPASLEKMLAQKPEKQTVHA